MNSKEIGSAAPGAVTHLSAEQEAVDRIALQLVNFVPRDAAAAMYGDDDEQEPDLEAALAATDAEAVVRSLYRAILGRKVDAGSKAAADVAGGLSPLLLAQFLLGSEEGRKLEAARRALLAREIAKRQAREDLGLPVTGALLPFALDPDVAFILACFRVGLGRTPRSQEFADARGMLAGGVGRERLLRVVWRDPKTAPRVFGMTHRNVRGLAALVVRRRKFSTFRTHVLAAESAVTAIILSLQPEVISSLSAGEREVDESSGSGAEPCWKMQARISELAAGIRRLTGDSGW
jgi:hypothetical protein